MNAIKIEMKSLLDEVSRLTAINRDLGTERDAESSKALTLSSKLTEAQSKLQLFEESRESGESQVYYLSFH